MGITDTLKDMFVSGDDPGVAYECARCGERFDTARQTCPACHGTDIEEVEGFDAAPEA
ncbi:MAG: hypothetical protein ABEJ26_09470 [Halosimplex sp.]